ncbi:MAG: hypothetical protein JW940_14685 [Polyangiaceae bacterium]|nr:hypothetical protein [Polyangiaceae bacterium]
MSSKSGGTGPSSGGASGAYAPSTEGTSPSTGGAGTGGVSDGTGGELPNTGGTTSTGGVISTGGRTSRGGATSRGGTPSTGVNTGTGGTTGQEPYKGVANSPAEEIDRLGASWCYNWGSTPKASECHDPYFVPMVWGGGDVAGAIAQISRAGYTTVLGFNEPNKPDQANMTVQQAIALWPDMTSNPNLRVSSPAVSDDGRGWLEDFMEQVQAEGLRVDFIAMHWYGWNAGSCVPGQLEGAVRWAEQWGLPIWVTEFGCMGSSNPDEQTLLSFFPAAVAMLEKHTQVERYAWYPWNDFNHLFLPDGNGVHVITALGELFAAAPAYR